MKLVLLLSSILVSFDALAECRIIEGDMDMDLQEPNEEAESTFFGGCRYVSPIFRAGYSNEHSGYIGIGALIPFSQQLDWEGGFIDKGIGITATRYSDGEILDLGYSDRSGWIFFTTGWELGLSYSNLEDQRMRGVYFGHTSIGSIVVRYLDGKDNKRVSLEFGYKY